MIVVNQNLCADGIQQSNTATPRRNNSRRSFKHQENWCVSLVKAPKLVRAIINFSPNMIAIWILSESSAPCSCWCQRSNHYATEASAGGLRKSCPTLHVGERSEISNDVPREQTSGFRRRSSPQPRVSNCNVICWSKHTAATGGQATWQSKTADTKARV